MLKVTRNNVTVKSSKGLVDTIFGICNQYGRDGAMETLYLYDHYGLLDEVLEHLNEKFSDGVNEVDLLDYLEDGIQSEKLYKKIRAYKAVYELKDTFEKSMGLKVSDKELELCKRLVDSFIFEDKDHPSDEIDIKTPSIIPPFKVG